MKRGNGVTSQWLSEFSVGANRRLLGRRRPEEAHARGHARDRLTSGRCPDRDSHASEAMRHNTGPVPEGGLARPPLEEGPAAGLPPPKTAILSHATWRGQDSTHAPAMAGDVMVCTAAGGASCDPRPPRATPRRPRGEEVPHATPTLATGQREGARWPGHAAETHVDSQARAHRKATARHANPTRQGAAAPGAPRLGPRRGSHAGPADRRLSPRTLRLGGESGHLQPAQVSATIGTASGSGEGR